MRRLIDLWPILLLLLLWQLWVSTAGYSSIVLVSPGAVFSDLLRFPGAYVLPALHTVAFALGGLAIGIVSGLILAMAAWFSEFLAGVTTPFALLLSSTPVVCLIPIVARLFGYEGRTELIAVAVMTFFPSFVLMRWRSERSSRDVTRRLRGTQRNPLANLAPASVARRPAAAGGRPPRGSDLQRIGSAGS